MAASDFWMLHRIRVRFNESDPQGLAHNAMNLVYFGVALGEYYRALDYDRFQTALHVVKATVEYKAPMRLDEEFDIGARIARFGRTSVTFVYEILSVPDGRVVSTGEQVWVNTDRETHKTLAWDPKFVALVKAKEGDRLAVDIPA